MEALKKAFDITDVVLLNSRSIWFEYAVFFILALVMRKTENKKRKKLGTVMVVASIPGLLISAFCLGLFVVATIKLAMIFGADPVITAGEHPEIQFWRMHCNGWPIDCMLLSVVVVPIMGIISIICGSIVSKDKSGFLISKVCILYGILFTLGNLLMLQPLLRAIAY